jgi:hypothetical protein
VTREKKGLQGTTSIFCQSCEPCELSVWLWQSAVLVAFWLGWAGWAGWAGSFATTCIGKPSVVWHGSRMQQAPDCRCPFFCCLFCIMVCLCADRERAVAWCCAELLVKDALDMYPVQKELRDAKMAQVRLPLTHRIVLTCIHVYVVMSGGLLYCCSRSWHAVQQCRV